jgi:outer membrane lipoprotein carrier protein
MKHAVLLALLCCLTPSQMAGTIGSQVYSKEQEASFLKKFDQVQEETITMISDFTEKKELTLLDQPAVSQGVLYYQRPNQILWEYQKPDSKKFLLTGDRLLSYYPEEKKAEQISIKRFRSHVFKFFCIGQLSKDLKDYYKIEVSNSQNSKNILMTLWPKKRKLKKRIDHLNLWIDRKALQLTQLQYVEVDGDKTTIRFDNLQINKDIPSSIFQIELPEDVEVKKRFTEFSNGRE